MQLGLATNSNSLMISVPTPVVEVNGSDVTIICGWVDSTLVIANTLLKQSPNFAGGVASDDYNEAIIFQRIQYVKSILSETRVLDDKTGAVLQKLQEDISKLFSSSSILNRSFVLKKAYPHTKSGAVIDIALVRSFFSELSCVDKLVSNICTNTPALTTTPHSFLQILIGSLKSNLTKLSNAMSFSLVSPIDRCRGVLIACLAEHEVLENILGEIFDVCSNLGEDGWDFISQWLRDAVNGGVEETASAGFKRHISKAVTAAPQPQSASSTSSFSLAVATPWDFYEFRRDLIVQVFSTLVDALNVKIGKSYTDREKDVLIKYAELTEKFYTINNIGFLTDRKLLLASEAGLPSVVKPATKIKIMHPRSSTRQHQNSSSNPPRNPQKEFGYPSSQSIIPHSKFANATISAGIDIATAYSLIRNDRRGGGSGSFPGGGLPYPSLPGIGIPGALSTGMDAISGLGAAILAQALGVGIRGPPSAAASADQAQSPAGLSGSNSNPAPASNSMNQNALLSEMLGGAGLNADLIAQSLQGGNARVVATHVGTQIGGRQHGNETFPPIPPEMLRRAQASGGTLIRGVITINPATMQMSVEFQAADGSPLGAQQAANVVDGVGGGGIGVPTRGAVADDVSRGNEGDDEGGGGASIGMEEDGDDDGSENSNGIDLLPDMENMADFAEFLGGLQAEESRDEDSNMYIDEDGGGDDDDEEEGGLTEAVAGEMANAFMGFLQSGNGPDQAAMAQRIQSLLNMRHSATSLNSNNANPASTNSTATRLSSNSSAPTLVVTPGHGGTSELSSLLPTPTSASSVPSLSVQSGSASSAVGATDASASNSLLSHIYSPSSRPTSSVGSSSIINRQSSSSVISNSPVAPAPVAASNHNRIHHNARPHNTASNPQLSAMLESLLNMNPLHSTIVQYPHLYDLGVKLSLLQLDSEMKQQERRNVSLFANIMSNRRHQAGAPTPEQQMFSKLELRRDHVWEDTLRIVGSDIAPDGTSNTHSAESSSSHSNNNSTNIAFSSSSHITSSVVGDLKKPLRVSFLGEEGLDEGGVSNEYMQLFFGLADKKNLFTVVNENPAEGPVLWFDPAAPTESCLRDYRIIGRVLGLAIYNSCLCSISFPQIMYKMLLGWHVGFEDFIKFRPQLARGFAEIMNFEGKDEDEEIFG